MPHWSVRDVMAGVHGVPVTKEHSEPQVPFLTHPARLCGLCGTTHQHKSWAATLKKCKKALPKTGCCDSSPRAILCRNIPQVEAQWCSTTDHRIASKSSGHPQDVGSNHASSRDDHVFFTQKGNSFACSNSGLGVQWKVWRANTFLMRVSWSISHCCDCVFSVEIFFVTLKWRDWLYLKQFTPIKSLVLKQSPPNSFSHLL